MCEEDIEEPPAPPHPVETKKQVEKKPKKPKKSKKKLYVNLQHTHYDIVHKVFAELGWIETEDDLKCTMLWFDAGGSSEICSSLQPWQFYNHFQAIWSIARKVELLRNYENMQSLLPDIYTFHPKSFLLPGQYAGLKTYMNSRISSDDSKQVTFIIKPDRGAQGRGIFLVQDPMQCEKYNEMAVAQEYIPPYLIDGYKFDLRLYVLITAVNPLRLYFHNEGMARFCTEKYTKPQQGNLTKVFGHLTNYSLNKKNDHFEKNTDANDATKGSKRSYSFVLDMIKKEGHDVDLLQRKIDRILRLTIASIQPRLEHNYKATISVSDDKCRCFEILGFDILLDDKLDPWLIEVNNMPSLSCDSPFDTRLKQSVVKGALEILDIQPGFKKLVSDEEKAVTQTRISGSTNLPRFNIFDPDKETEISKKTNWRKFYPLEDDEEETAIMEKAIATAKSLPTVGPITTLTQKARIKAKEKEEKLKQKKEIEEEKIRDINKKKFAQKDKESEDKEEKKPKEKNKPPHRLFNPPQIRCAPRFLPQTRLVSDDSTFKTLFKVTEGNQIPFDEERDRLMNVRKQAIDAQTVNMLTSIRLMLSDNNEQQKQPVVAIPSTIVQKTPIKLPKVSKIVQPVSKSKVPLSTVLIGEGYKFQYGKK